MKKNYQLELDKEIEKITKSDELPSLLLHSCCGPCSSYVLEYLSKYFKVTVLYFNPNIYPEEEFLHRQSEQKRIISELPVENKVSFMESEYNYKDFLSAAKGFENEREGGARCDKCFRLRLKKTAQLAAENGFDYFTTTLSVSPHKNSQLLNLIGEELGEEYGVKHLPADFKKREGYKRSIELSKQYDLYRQNYCGCEFSLRQAQEQQK
ncbi:MAG: epoxyqueuosine reductase QueH [Clostridia bacterium]|nr:epoxyqueuosine reductase QueH [Clostridia bacterium]